MPCCGSLLVSQPVLVSASNSTAFPFRIEFPPELPISARAEEIVACIRDQQVLILAGETGSGKTTQIPKMCLAAGRGLKGRIACTQPRRVAALSISRRVAEELAVEWGAQVGCKVRFNDQTSRDTTVKFLTDGMLLAEVQGDPLLREYDTIIIDEAHERSLNIDFLLGHLRQLRFKRPELRIVITSATIDTEAFSEAFDKAPVIQVSGRTYPVEVVYLPLDRFGSDFVEEEDEGLDAEDRDNAKAEALHYVDGAVEAVTRILRDSDSGDVLVFMPSERDIRETCEALEGGRGPAIELIPLFGRLSNAEQQRVFAPTRHRKVIVATNIAETSLTLPGIRFVVDTGLTRMSRYSPQARTRRLPIEPVSQSSADQRKGRAGRVAEGVCIRLYSEKDYEARPRFTQPEIQRANLADVVLRLKAFGLGDIERFPFINPPSGKAIRSGYALLEELGAVEEDAVGGGHRLTSLGMELARLPVDPTVGRMLLQARKEHCLAELLVIAAGLSIQDPRERPLEKQAAADTAHRRFTHPDSDFLTLLRIWELYHGDVERLSQARLRRFCKDHFLSYVRMREWRDIHTQLVEALRERRDFRPSSVRDKVSPPSAPGRGGAQTEEQAEKELRFGSRAYTVIHRSILSGLLGNIALLDEDSGAYKATHDRRVALFPGSTLFRRPERSKGGRGEAPKAEKKPSKGPRWIVASEIVETSRVWARTNARLDARWVLDLGRHLFRVSHSEPFWDPPTGRVLVRQRTRLGGLEIDTRAVGYGRVNPLEATRIFIREGLVADAISFPLDFLAHNRAVRERIEVSLTRTRDSGYLNLDEALFRFYDARLVGEAALRLGGLSGADALRAAEQLGFAPVSCVQELVALVRARQSEQSDFLFLQPEDLRDPESLTHDAQAFPEALPLSNNVLPLSYAYKPGTEEDGVTLDVNVRDAETLTEAALDWAVPGHVEEKVGHFLRALPKELRKDLSPLAETTLATARRLAGDARLRDHAETLQVMLAAELRARFGIRFDAGVWAERPLPQHLKVRVRVVDDKGAELCASRDLAEVQKLLSERQRAVSEASAREEPAVWKKARRHWERPAAESWVFGAVPASVVIGEQAGVPLLAWTAFVCEGPGVALRLRKEEGEAAVATRHGLARLLELALTRDLMWLERDLRHLRELGPQAALIAPQASLQADLFVNLRRWLTDPTRIRLVDGATGPVLREEAFSAAVSQAREALQGLLPRVVDMLREVVDLRQVLSVHPQAPKGLSDEIFRLVPASFLATTPWARLWDLPRYLKAKRLRIERARTNPLKDDERVKQFAPYEKALARLERSSRVYWLIEEFRVSVFAQELGTSESVSAVKLDALLEDAGRSPELAPSAVPTPAQPAFVQAPMPTPRKRGANPLNRADLVPEAAEAEARRRAEALLGKPQSPRFAQTETPVASSAAATPKAAPSVTPQAESHASSSPKQTLKSLDILNLPGLPQKGSSSPTPDVKGKAVPSKTSKPAAAASKPSPPVSQSGPVASKAPAGKGAPSVASVQKPATSAGPVGLQNKSGPIKSLGALDVFLRKPDRKA